MSIRNHNTGTTVQYIDAAKERNKEWKEQDEIIRETTAIKNT